METLKVKIWSRREKKIEWEREDWDAQRTQSMCMEIPKDTRF